MDRDRLKQIEQSDLTESRVNQDFVDWLKSKGPNWLLVILVALCAYMLIVRWKQHRFEHTAEAWAALSSADLPKSLEDVAEEYGDVDGLAPLARLQAAKRYLVAIRAGTTVGAAAALANADPNSQDKTTIDQTPLSDEQRSQYLDEAQRLFQAVQDEVKDATGDEPGRKLLRVAALDGLAAVFEARGDPAKARDYYAQSADVAGTEYPHLAMLNKDRMENVDQASAVAALPTKQQTGSTALVTSFQADAPTLTMMQSLKRIIESDDDASADSATSASAPAGP